MKEKIIQIVPTNATFWGSLKTGIMFLTDKGNIWVLDREGKLEKVKNLPSELKPE